MDNSVIGVMILSAIALFGASAFYFDFVHPHRKRKHPQK